MIANGGYHIQPTLLKKKNPKVQKIDTSLAFQIREALSYVTTREGSAPLAHINGFTIAGKTSTSEKLEKGIYSKKKHFSSFVGMVPANKPRFVILVVVDEPAYKVVQGFGSLQLWREMCRSDFSFYCKKNFRIPRGIS